MRYNADGSLEKIFFVDVSTFVFVVLFGATCILLSVVYLWYNLKQNKLRLFRYLSIANIAFSILLALYIITFFQKNYPIIYEDSDYWHWIELLRHPHSKDVAYAMVYSYAANAITTLILLAILLFDLLKKCLKRIRLRSQNPPSVKKPS